MQIERRPINENERTFSSTLIAAAMILGLIFPQVSAFFFDYVFHFLFLVVVFSFCSVNANILSVLSEMDGNSCKVLGWQMFGIPMIVTIACFLMNTDNLTTSVLIATTTAGSVFASPALAELMGLDRRVAIRKMLVSTFLMPLSLLFFGELNGILPIDLPLFDYIQHVVFFLVVPVIIAMTYWEMLPRLGREFVQVSDHTMHWLATLSLMGFCVGIMYKLHGRGEEHYETVLHYVFLVAAVVIAVYVVTMLLFSHLGQRRALTLGMLAANRNVALSFALISDLLPKEALAYVAVAQFPIFLLPLFARVFLATSRVRRPDVGAGAKAD